MTTPITVSALSDAREFKDLDALAEHVQEILAHRGGVFTPMEVACISELSARANGQAGPDVHRIARSASVHAPAPPPRGPTPFDEQLEDARATLEERTAAHQAAREHRFQVLDAGRKEMREIGQKVRDGEVDALYAQDARVHWERQVQDATEEDFRREGDWRRANARLNALTMAADRWYHDSTRQVFLGFDERGERRYGTPAELTEWRRSHG